MLYISAAVQKNVVDAQEMYEGLAGHHALEASSQPVPPIFVRPDTAPEQHAQTLCVTKCPSHAIFFMLIFVRATLASSS